MKRVLAIAFQAAALILLGCGGGSAPQEVEWARDARHESLAVTDSIGIETGDSNFVFGQIAGAAYAPDGRIAVLDMKQKAVLFYSPDGSFLMRVGRQGSGPGEFLMPSSISFYRDGSMVVGDAMAQKLTSSMPRASTPAAWRASSPPRRSLCRQWTAERSSA